MTKTSLVIELNLDLHKSSNELSLDLHKSGDELSLDLHKSGDELSLDLHINESPKWNSLLLDFLLSTVSLFRCEFFVLGTGHSRRNYSTYYSSWLHLSSSCVR